MTDTVFNYLWDTTYETHKKVVDATFSALKKDVAEWVDISANAIKSGGKILFCGNGGSAADAQHLAAELAVRLKETRKAIPALCLNLDASAMTACGNDFGFEYIFSRQIEALGRPEDVLVAISTSGKSPNVLKAIETAKQMGMKIVGLTGRSGNVMAAMCDVLINIPDTDETARIQEMHITLGHIFCFALEKRLNLV